ncbi:MAG: PAS domain-containing protein [Chloroflexi bacterium]|nr:PAS domain-containing protein [Chloroflexota bacterium]
MSWQLVLSTIVLIASATLLGVVGVIAWRYRPAPGARLTATVIWLACAWSIAYVAELMSPDLASKMLFAKLQYLAIVALPAAWLALVLEYTDQDRWMTAGSVAIVAALPAVTLILVWTTEIHGLMWQTYILDRSGPFPALSVTYGPWFWVHTAFSYTLIGLGILVLVRATRNTTHLSRAQVSVLLISILTPVAGNVIHLARVVPVPNLDLTTYAFLVSGLALLWGLLRSQFLDLVPIARDRVVNNMTDGFLVLSPNNRIVDINTATLNLIGKSEAEVIGKPVQQVINLPVSPAGATFHDASAIGEFIVGTGDNQCSFETRTALLQDKKGRLRGQVVLLTDVTDMKRAQLALQDTIQRKDIAYQQAIIYSNELNQEIRGRKSAEEALRALSHKLAELQESERRHLARELHDEIGQALTGLRFVIESSRESQAHSPKLEEAMEIINNLIQQVHDLSLDLRPTVLDDLGLLPALFWYIERYSAQRGIRVNFTHRGLDRRFPSDIETAVYRIVQEGLTNVSKYAKVDTVDVSIWTTESHLQVQIEDTGVGFDVAQALMPPNSSGLVGMKERVSLLGGSFAIDSARGEGTRLTAEIPLHQVVSEQRT